MTSQHADAGPYSVITAIQAHRLAVESERNLARSERNLALAIILARLDEARRENAAAYITDRAHRETSADLS